jgi:DUF971 family protein
MSRKINITKYQGNTHYSVSVTDKYGQEHHIGYYKHLYTNKLQEKAEEIWSNEVKQEVDLMSLAILDCIEIDKKSGRTLSLD